MTNAQAGWKWVPVLHNKIGLKDYLEGVLCEAVQDNAELARTQWLVLCHAGAGDPVLP